MARVRQAEVGRRTWRAEGSAGAHGRAWEVLEGLLGNRDKEDEGGGYCRRGRRVLKGVGVGGIPGVTG